MKTRKIYDSDYAKEYDNRFLTSEYAKTASDFELSILKNIIKPNSKWLDVGCGTGYFLSFFPNTERCGIDISEDMLSFAKERNANAKFIQGDFRGILPQMTEKWDVVSCMWTPYNYLESMYEFDTFITNLIEVTEIGGTLFIPVVDLEDLRPHTIVDYDMYSEIHQGNVQLTSTTWSFLEDNGKIHTHLIAPQIGYFIDKLNGYFETIEIVRYPVYQDGWVSRKAILARNKFKEKEESLVVEDKLSPILSENLEIDIKESIDKFTTKELIKEIVKRLFNK